MWLHVFQKAQWLQAKWYTENVLFLGTICPALSHRAISFIASVGFKNHSNRKASNWLLDIYGQDLIEMKRLISNLKRSKSLMLEFREWWSSQTLTLMLSNLMLKHWTMEMLHLILWYSFESILYLPYLMKKPNVALKFNWSKK